MRLTLALLLCMSSSAYADEIRTATPEELTVIEQNMDQFKFVVDPASVKITTALLTDKTFCGRMDATKKNGTKITGYTIYGAWFGGEAVAPIAMGVGARRMCDLDKYPK